MASSVADYYWGVLNSKSFKHFTLRNGSWANHSSRSLGINAGIHQDCILGPTLFIICIIHLPDARIRNGVNRYMSYRLHCFSHRRNVIPLTFSYKYSNNNCSCFFGASSSKTLSATINFMLSVYCLRHINCGTLLRLLAFQ